MIMKLEMCAAMTAIIVLGWGYSVERQAASGWKHAYEQPLEIHESLEELVKEFRTACAER